MQDHIINFAESLVVFETGLSKERIGRSQDGGYVVCTEACSDSEVLYSYGVSDDWSFEEEFSNRFGCNSFLYDHTVDLESRSNSRLRFRKEGLSSSPTDQTNTFQSHITSNSDEGKKISLKLDIEWNEWDFFDSVPSVILERISHVVCEFHLIPAVYSGNHTPYFTGFHKDVYNGINQLLFERYTRVLEKINRSHLLYHVHVNNSLTSFEYKNCKIPYLLECSFVNKRYAKRKEKSKTIFPIEGLDFPNKPYKEEILNFYPLINGK
jgi:hypothetical protein